MGQHKILKTEEKKDRQEVTISRRKFDPLKIHSSAPVEKFKPESPKNILKKRPYGYF